ncbi:MAG: methyl-accepting chemotaxis protein, partial [Bacillota bacterium]
SLETEKRRLEIELDNINKQMQKELDISDNFNYTVSTLEKTMDLVKEPDNNYFKNEVDLILSTRIEEETQHQFTKYGFEIRDNKFNKIYNRGYQLDAIYNNSRIKDVYQQIAKFPTKMKLTFFNEHDEDFGYEEELDNVFIEIASISKVSPRGFSLKTGVLMGGTRYTALDMYMIFLPKKYNRIVQLYIGEEFFDTNYFFGDTRFVNNIENNLSNRILSETDIVDEKIVEYFTNNKDIDSYIEMRKIETSQRVANNSINAETSGQNFEEDTIQIQKNYLVGYVPLRNYYNEPIAYITMIRPLDRIDAFIAGIRMDYIYNAIIFILISLLIILLITRSITKPLKNMLYATRKIAKGNLTIDVETNTRDQIAEVAHNFNDMVAKLRDIVGEIIGASNNVTYIAQELSANTQGASAVSEEVAATSRDIAEGTEEQAKYTSNTKGILDVVEKQAVKVVDGSNRVKNSIEKATKESNKGIDVMNSVSDDINHILDEVDNTGKEVISLKEQINNINDIIEAINYINEETTMLSLNAAIEAARAGKAGRGFAVVADEIRKLADKSKHLVQEIDNIFKKINVAMDQVDNSMTESIQLAQKGEGSVKNAQKSFEDILDSIKQVQTEAAEINQYINEQKNSSKEIAKVMENVHEIAQTNAEGADQSARSNEEQVKIIEHISLTAEELSDMADNLKSLINKFDIN